MDRHQCSVLPLNQFEILKIYFVGQLNNISIYIQFMTNKTEFLLKQYLNHVEHFQLFLLIPTILSAT